MLNQLSQKWNLDSLFSSKDSFKDFDSFLDTLQKDFITLQREMQNLSVIKEPSDSQLFYGILALQDASGHLETAYEFAACLVAENTESKSARSFYSRIVEMRSIHDSLVAELVEVFLRIPDPLWQKLMTTAELSPIAFALDEMRRRAKEHLPLKEEKIISELAPDGYYAWRDLRQLVESEMSIPHVVDGVSKSLSIGQAYNVIFLAGDRVIREKLFPLWEDAWKEKEEVFATAFNHLAGFRLRTYRARNWPLLRETFDLSRVSEKTIQTMWSVVASKRELYARFFSQCSKILHVPKLSWHDTQTSIFSSSSSITLDEAASIIIKAFHRFSPRFQNFAEQAFMKGWIEADDRSGKGPGAFCSSFPTHKESRIFSTFSGSQNDVRTLAHEIGHAYHHEIVKDLPLFLQHYSISLAETASNFAELLLSDALLQEVTDATERLSIIEQRARDGVMNLTNIYARFLFETRAYEERAHGFIPAIRLNEIMTEAQKEAFSNSLSTYHPRFWASKWHFFITDPPFYNYPYAFGYLLSLGLFSKYKSEGSSFVSVYDRFLEDTGKMSCEGITKKHLGVDIREPKFWEGALSMCESYITDFLEASHEKI